MTPGLDARAAAIVMRTIRNTVDTGRTVVCTIHQPSIDIFEVRRMHPRGGPLINLSRPLCVQWLISSDKSLKNLLDLYLEFKV